MTLTEENSINDIRLTRNAGGEYTSKIIYKSTINKDSEYLMSNDKSISEEITDTNIKSFIDDRYDNLSNYI